MKNYLNKNEFKCDIADKLIANKKAVYCKNCENCFAGVCRYTFDKNF